MMKDKHAQVTEITIHGGSMYDEGALSVGVDDQGGGQYIRIRQHGDSCDSTVEIDPDEWPLVRDAVIDIIAGINSAASFAERQKKNKSSMGGQNVT